MSADEPKRLECVVELERLHAVLDAPDARSLQEALQLDANRSAALEACGDALLAVVAATQEDRGSFTHCLICLRSWSPRDDYSHTSACPVPALDAVIREHLSAASDDTKGSR